MCVCVCVCEEARRCRPRSKVFVSSLSCPTASKNMSPSRGGDDAIATSPVDPIQLTIFRLIHDMCTHYRHQFTEFEGNTAPKYRAMVHSAWTSMMESSLRLFSGTPYTKILELADGQRSALPG
eukprot:COSAG01_NODE_113_length_25617_cov_10.523492_14_plen_123_part_00